MTTIDGPALLLRIYIGETDQWHGQPLYHAIVAHARHAGDLRRIAGKQRECVSGA